MNKKQMEIRMEAKRIADNTALAILASIEEGVELGFEVWPSAQCMATYGSRTGWVDEIDCFTDGYDDETIEYADMVTGMINTILAFALYGKVL